MNGKAAADLSDLTTFVVSSDQSDSVRIAHLQKEIINQVTPPHPVPHTLRASSSRKVSTL